MDAYFWHRLFVILLIIGFYLEVPLNISQTAYIPAFINIFSIPLLIFINYKFINSRDLFFILTIFAILLISVFGGYGHSFDFKKIMGIGQTTISILAGILLSKEVARISDYDFEKILLFFCISLLAGTILERLEVLRGFSDAFRNYAYSVGGYGVYDNDSRDMELANFIRPKLFTSEPSLLAIGFYVLSTSWFVNKTTFKRWVLFIGATIAMIFLTGSPILFISIPISLIFYLIYSNQRWKTFFKITLCAFCLLMFNIFFEMVPKNIFTRLVDAFERKDFYEISSENLRMVFPFITMNDVLEVSPLFGVGISGKEEIILISSLPIDPGYALGNNNLALLFIYLGLFGAALLLLTFFFYLKKIYTGKEYFALAIWMIGFMQMMGGFESPRFWGYAFIFISALSLKSCQSMQFFTPLSERKH